MLPCRMAACLQQSEKGLACAQSGSPETRWERWQRKQHNQWVRKTNAENYSQRCDFQNKMRVRPSAFVLPSEPPGAWASPAFEVLLSKAVMAFASCGHMQDCCGLQQTCSTTPLLAASRICPCNSSRFPCGCAQVAEQFRDEPGMWFPHNMDFRGRAYPMPPHLNHLGSDTSRGILQFAEGRALGEDGLNWLYIQVEQLSLSVLHSYYFLSSGVACS